MEFVFTLLENLGRVLAGLALNPFYYAALLIAAVCYRRQVVLQRRLFHTRLHAPAGLFLHSLLWGWPAGLAVSVVASGTGLVINTATMLWVWAVSLALLLFRVRYFGTVYAAAAVILLHEAVRLFPVPRGMPAAGEWLAALDDIHPPSLLALTALLMAAEALLVWLFGPRLSSPLYVDGKRGKTIGAYQWQAFWALPMFLAVPAGSGAGLAEWLPWPRFFGEEAVWAAGWTLLAFPAALGFSGMSAASTPGRLARRGALAMLAAAAVLAAFSAAAELWPLSGVLAAAGAIAALLFREWIVIAGDRRERDGKPLFVHEGKGLKVLAVVPGGPAAEMGIAPGETIVRVNGRSVSSGEELHAALRANPAFCKLEVSDLAGETRFAQRALFAGDHHQLGIVLCPDDRSASHIRWRPLTLPSLLAPLRGIARHPASLAASSGGGEAPEKGEARTESGESREDRGRKARLTAEPGQPPSEGAPQESESVSSGEIAAASAGGAEGRKRG